jgi:hypothetical protein
MKIDQALKEENKKIRHLRLMVDLTCQLLYQEKGLTLSEGLNRIQSVKTYAESLFPEKGDVFDLIYRPRLIRILKERGLFNPSLN